MRTVFNVLTVILLTSTVHAGNKINEESFKAMITGNYRVSNLSKNSFSRCPRNASIDLFNTIYRFRKHKDPKRIVFTDRDEPGYNGNEYAQTKFDVEQSGNSLSISYESGRQSKAMNPSELILSPKKIRDTQVESPYSIKESIQYKESSFQAPYRVMNKIFKVVDVKNGVAKKIRVSIYRTEKNSAPVLETDCMYTR